MARLERVFIGEVAAGRLEPFARPVTSGPLPSWPTSVAAAAALAASGTGRFCAMRAKAHVDGDIRSKVPGVKEGEPCYLPRRPHFAILAPTPHNTPSCIFAVTQLGQSLLHAARRWWPRRCSSAAALATPS